MYPRYVSFPLILLCTALPFSACTSNNDMDPGAGNADMQIPDNLPTDDSICTMPLTQQLDGKGGSIVVPVNGNSRLAGTTLYVPPGTLSGPTLLQLTCGDSLAEAGETVLSASVRFLPDGLTFSGTANLTLLYDKSKVPLDATVVLAVKPQGGTRTLFSGVKVNPAGSAVTADIAHFSDYQVLAVNVPPPPPPTNNVDVLFVVDNSPSMSPKQKAMATTISKFVTELDNIGVDYHIGVVSTDIGSTVAPGQPWSGSVGTCNTYEGDDGMLQNLPCTARSGVTSDARAACAMLCPDDRFVPTDGKHYISKVGGMTNVPQDVKPDPISGKMVDFGPSNAFKCMALLGDGGCGVESPLAAARRALDGHRAENSGFLRPDSLLAVIFLTDEDDCSVQLSRRSENNPETVDCATPNQNADANCFNIDYRCLARSVACDQPMNTMGPHTNCKERPLNYLDPISSYQSFFRGLRAESRLVIGGIWTLPALTAGGKLVVARVGGGMTSNYLNRAQGVDASCQYAGMNPDFSGVFGQAQLRLSAFAAGFADAKQYSICDVDNIGRDFAELAAQMADKAHK